MEPGDHAHFYAAIWVNGFKEMGEEEERGRRGI